MISLKQSDYYILTQFRLFYFCECSQVPPWVEYKKEIYKKKCGGELWKHFIVKKICWHKS